MSGILFTPIGIIHSPLRELSRMPIQSAGGKEIRGTVEIFPPFVGGLKDLDGFSHIILVFYFHLSGKSSLEVVPFLDDKPHGVFATRAPVRPNPIGLSTVRLLEIRDNLLFIEEMDMVDGTPLLDIKPCIPEMDYRQVERTGWFRGGEKRVKEKQSDDRFISPETSNR